MSTVLSMGRRAVVQQHDLPDYVNSSSKCRFNCCEDAETVLCSSQDGVLLNEKRTLAVQQLINSKYVLEPNFNLC
jgi:hypothetical protein